MAAPRKDNVKEKILTTSEELILVKDINDLTLNDIALKAGISKGTLYYHYKCKDDILLDVLDRYLEKCLDDLMLWTEDSGKDTSLHRYVMYVLKYYLSSSALRVHLICDALSGNEKAKQRLTVRYREFAEILANKAAERTDKIEGKTLAWFILLISDGMAFQKALDSEFDEKDYIDKCIEYAKLLEK